jgi:hypothetical protein
MRRVAPLVGLLASAVAMSVSACASSNSPGAASASGSVVAVSSPAAGSGSTVQVSSPAPGCPPVAGGPSGSRSSAPPGQLFVVGSPTVATLCQYVSFTADGSSPPPPVLVQITGTALTELIASLNALVSTNDVLPCPAPAHTDLLVFVGAGPPSIVQVDLAGGCNFVWSDTGVHAYATTALLHQLTAIVANAPESASPAAGSSSPATVAVGDAAAIAQCQAAENVQQAAILAAGGTPPALTVAAGFTTTEGDAHRYADSLGRRPGDPSPRPPAGSPSYYTSTTPVVACILDGYIEAPSVPGNPPYSREFALVVPGGTLDQLMAGRTDTIGLQNPSSAMP